jgi:hypothetical protein
MNVNFEKIIDKYQHMLVKSLNENTKITYKNNIIPIIEQFTTEMHKNRLFNELYSYELPKNYMTTEYHIVIESIAKILSYKSIDDLNIKTRLMIYNKYPILVYNLLLNSNVTKIKDMVNMLLDKCIGYNFVKTTSVYENLLELKNYCDNFNDIIKYNSALCIFNNFYGIDFNCVGVTFDNLPKTNYLLINIGYNMKREQNNVVYTSNKQYSKFYLDEDIIDKYKFMTKIKIQPNDKLYELNENNTNNYSIIINYNNDNDITKCYFSITDAKFTKEQINNLLNGGILMGCSRISYEIYISTLLYIYNNKIDKNKEDMISIISKIYPILKRNYDEQPKLSIQKWRSWSANEFKDVLEQKLFNIYIDKLNQMLDEENVLDYQKYIGHIINYFIIDISES